MLSSGPGGPGDQRAQSHTPVLQVAVRGLGAAPRPPGLARSRGLRFQRLISQRGRSPQQRGLIQQEHSCVCRRSWTESTFRSPPLTLIAVLHTPPGRQPQHTARHEGETHASRETTPEHSPPRRGDTRHPGDNPSAQPPGRVGAGAQGQGRDSRGDKAPAPPGGCPREDSTRRWGGRVGRQASRRTTQVSGPGFPPRGAGAGSGESVLSQRERPQAPSTARRAVGKASACTVTLSEARPLPWRRDSTVEATRVTPAAHREGVASIKHARCHGPRQRRAARPRQEARR